MAQNSLERYKVVPSSVATPQRFYELRRISGLTPPPADLVAVTAGLANTWFGVTIVDTQYQGKVAGDEVVGMGRIVGDGAMMLFLSDVCKGLAKHIMETLVNYVDEHAPDAQINLTGDPPVSHIQRKGPY
ncbi:hypothetical protein BKA62DRAFT_708577 [Auriculariales sp. MPI-PUGE-AT-0066]|nr:hypothetical protein BKA62DRAFT_708577 [Auriculariales sp. MPI-PUGE-AT-0066]